MDTTLPVSFQNLGLTGRITLNGNGGSDSLAYLGTAANDNFVINSSGGGVLPSAPNAAWIWTP